MDFSRLFFRAVLALGPAIAGPGLTTSALALEISTHPIAVVELFTSQGCSRCPEADAFLAELGMRADIVTLAYHIDYWDYAGWEDTFASPANTELQKAYALSWSKNRVYTPQMVVNGTHGAVGSDRNDVLKAIGNDPLDIKIIAEPVGEDGFKLTAPPAPGRSNGVVWLVTYREGASVTIDRGENAGRALTYSHIVVSRRAIGMWDALEGTEISVPLAESLGENGDAAAILIQEKNGALPGAILGALVVSR